MSYDPTCKVWRRRYETNVEADIRQVTRQPRPDEGDAEYRLPQPLAAPAWRPLSFDVFAIFDVEQRARKAAPALVPARRGRGYGRPVGVADADWRGPGRLPGNSVSIYEYLGDTLRWDDPEEWLCGESMAGDSRASSGWRRTCQRFAERELVESAGSDLLVGYDVKSIWRVVGHPSVGRGNPIPGAAPADPTTREMGILLEPSGPWECEEYDE